MKLHSVVGFITNSSSETYTFATFGSVDSLKDLMNALLQAIGVPERFDDLFDVQFVMNVNLIATNNDLKNYMDTQGIEFVPCTCTDDEGNSLSNENGHPEYRHGSFYFNPPTGCPANWTNKQRIFEYCKENELDVIELYDDGDSYKCVADLKIVAKPALVNLLESSGYDMAKWQDLHNVIRNIFQCDTFDIN